MFSPDSIEHTKYFRNNNCVVGLIISIIINKLIRIEPLIWEFIIILMTRSSQIADNLVVDDCYWSLVPGNEGRHNTYLLAQFLSVNLINFN